MENAIYSCDSIDGDGDQGGFVLWSTITGWMRPVWLGSLNKSMKLCSAEPLAFGNLLFLQRLALPD